jgi:glycosyltransferase involved in cell wall biosynthesis
MLSMPGLVKELRDEGYDIVHLQYPSKGFGMSSVPGFLPGQLAGMKSRSRVVLTLHEWNTSHPLRRMLMDQMLPAAYALITTNEKDFLSLKKKAGDKLTLALPVGNVLASRTELEAVWLRHAGESVPELPAPSGMEVRIPNSIFHYGLPARGKLLFMLLRAIKTVRDGGIPLTLYLGGEYPPGHQSTENLLKKITELELAEAVVRLGHIPRDMLAATAQKYCLAVFPFEEGYSAKRSSVATISHLDLPVMVGPGGETDHPYYTPEQNTAASWAVSLTELFTGRLAAEWTEQVLRQRTFAKRFSFSQIALEHIELYQKVLEIDS